MNQKQLLELIGAMKHQILDLLINQNMADDQAAQQTLSVINEMFNRMNLDVEGVIPQETLTAYFGGVDEATKALDKAGIDPKGGLAASISSSGKVASAFNNHVHMEAIAEITDNTMLDMKAAIRTAKNNTNASIETALSAVKSDLQSGVIQGKARKVTTQRVAESFAKEGVTSFTTVDGKRLPLDFYSQVVTRTNLKTAHTKGAGERYRENGMDLFKVTGNTPTCHQCAPLRGIVFTLNPDRTDYTYMDPVDIVRHPNCNCSMSVWVEEYKTDAEINKAQKESKAFNPDKDTRSKSQKESYKKQQDLHRKNNETKKQFARYRSVLDEKDMPKTLGGFKRSKKSGSDNFKEIQRKYRREMNKIRG